MLSSNQINYVHIIKIFPIFIIRDILINERNIFLGTMMRILLFMSILEV